MDVVFYNLVDKAFIFSAPLQLQGEFNYIVIFKQLRRCSWCLEVTL
jgi:hypothetical protein